MNLIQEYEFESLPYIDSEYDDPVVKEAVRAIISQEMKMFSPLEKNYLAHLPYPNLSFSKSPNLAVEYDRISKTGSRTTERLDTQRYIIKGPGDGPLQKDIQAWRKSVLNAKCQYEYETNKQINLDVVPETINQHWLAYNKQLDQYNISMQEEVASKKRKISEINVVRRVAQEKASTEINRFVKRRDNATSRQNQIYAACSRIITTLPSELKEKFIIEVMDIAVDEEINGSTDNETY